MRFEVSKVLDAIEARLSTDPALARAVVDLSEVVRYADLDGGRPASLLRLGLVIDALGRHVGGGERPGLRGRAARPALRRRPDLQRADGGPPLGRRRQGRGASPSSSDRVLEVAELLGLPVLTRARDDSSASAGPWVDEPGRLLAAVPGAGGPVLVARVGRGEAPAGRRALAGWASGCSPGVWRCPEPNCARFGGGGGADSPFADMRTVTSPVAQPPPALRAGVPTCPRHGTRLSDAGPRPRSRGAVRTHRRRDPPAVRGLRRPAGGGRPGPRRRRRRHARPVAQRRRPEVDQPRARPVRPAPAARLTVRTSAPTAPASGRAARWTTTSGSRWQPQRVPYARPRRRGRALRRGERGPVAEMWATGGVAQTLGDGRGADHGDAAARP